MSAAYPLTLPTAKAVRSVRLGLEVVAPRTRSPFSLKAQKQLHSGRLWHLEAELPVMKRDDAEEWIAFRLRLRGSFGTFLIGDPMFAAPRGTWGGSPVADSAGSPTVNQIGDTDFYIRGLTNGATVKAGDMFQLGSGAASRLHKNLTTQTVGANGRLKLDIEPPLRDLPADGAAIVTSSPKGVFELDENLSSWNVDEALIYGELVLRAVEAL